MLPTRGTGSESAVDDFAYELAWDGVRAIVHLTPLGTRLESRVSDLTRRYPELADLHRAVDRDAILDGELVVMRGDQVDVSALQHRRRLPTEEPVAWRPPVVYVAYDLLWLDGRPLWPLPYETRRRTLEDLAPQHASLLMGASYDSYAPAVAQARRVGLNGLVAKRRGSPYRMKERSSDWRVLPFVHREPLVVGGFVPGTGQRDGMVGSLLLGQYPAPTASHLAFLGSVGTGFTRAQLEEVSALVRHREYPESPFASPVNRPAVRFCEPSVVVWIQYRDRTRSGALRYPVYQGLAHDVAAADVVATARAVES